MHTLFFQTLFKYKKHNAASIHSKTSSRYTYCVRDNNIYQCIYNFST